MAGMIVGNKNTKVYHLAGDKGGMPSAKNAVYFRSEAQARSAGYRPAGTRRTPSPQRPGTTGTPMPRPQGSFGRRLLSGVPKRLASCPTTGNT